MDFLLDALTDWLKEMLVGGIMSNLSGMFDNLLNTLLYKPVPDAGYPQRSGGAIGLWDFLPSHRFGSVSMPRALDNVPHLFHHFVGG